MICEFVTCCCSCRPPWVGAGLEEAAAVGGDASSLPSSSASSACDTIAPSSLPVRNILIQHHTGNKTLLLCPPLTHHRSIQRGRPCPCRLPPLQRQLLPPQSSIGRHKRSRLSRPAREGWVWAALTRLIGGRNGTACEF